LSFEMPPEANPYLIEKPPFLEAEAPHVLINRAPTEPMTG
jgi:hypothetical protein